MPNQLPLPFKKTYIVPIRQAARDYISSHYSDTHPDAYRWDIAHWEKLRAEATSGGIHVDRIHAMTRSIGLEIPYAPAFDSDALPQTLKNLVYERAAVLYNLAALFSQLGAAEDRSTPHGLKQAIKYYQNSAGALDYLNEAALPQLQASMGPDDESTELSEPFVKSLEYLMLAQAQECVWQRAVMDNYKNGLIAKLAAKHWLSHLETKQLHFQAAAQYRKSLEDLEAHNYGHEIARLSEAQTLAKRGYDAARRGGVAQPVQQDIKSLLDILQKNVARAERDNDLIYHQDVPPASALPPIAEVAMAQPLIHPGLQDPKAVVGQDAVIFGELLGWGARLAIDIYNDRRRDWITEEIQDRVRHLDDALSSTLEALNLPAALDALDRPIGLPPSLIKKAEEVRLESGPERVETYIRDVQVIAQHVSSLLDEAMDILDQEADEDEALREAHSVSDRVPSLEANRTLIEKAQQYRSVLDQARESDALVREKWEEWEDAIAQLTWSEEDLENSIPSSTVSFGQRAGVTDPTRVHARALRTFLERLEDLSKARTELVARVNRLASSDDITPRISKAASAMEQWVNVQPAMFEDILDEELAKYDRFRVQLDENGQKQDELLQAVKGRHAEFVRTRKDDSVVKEREIALQSLDLAFHKYKEIIRNLEEGQKFYNDFSAIVSQFRASCKDYAAARREEASVLSRVMEALAIATPPPEASLGNDPDSTASSVTEQAMHPASSGQAKPKGSTDPVRPPGRVFDLPPPDSDEWETMTLPPAPAVPKRADSERRAPRTAQKGR
ncbi:BRO1-domain-containing protein [Trametes elegans]|nr:BRO1-domain-containing protein [Trametes elegans]